MQDNEIDQNKVHGFVKLWRSIRQWEWYTLPETSHLFLHLILSANWENKQWRGFTINRGQYMTSLNHLAIETGLSFSQVRTSLGRLIKSKDILTTTTNQNTLVTILKYDRYQDKDVAVDNRITNKLQTDNKLIATTKETKEIKEYKERKSTLSNFEFLQKDCLKQVESIKSEYKLPSKEWNLCIGKFNEKKNKDLGIEVFRRYVNNWKNNLNSYDTQPDILSGRKKIRYSESFITVNKPEYLTNEF